MSDATRPDLYNCGQAFARLFEFLDRVLDPGEEERVRGHLAACEECVRHFKFEEDLLIAIREKCNSSPAPEHLRKKITQLLDAL